MKKNFIILIIFTIFFGFSQKSYSQVEYKLVVHYFNPHPIPPAYGGGFCTIHGPHTHPYVPLHLEFYTVYDGYYYFIGDPYIYGYSGPVYWYLGPHILYTEFGPVMCYIDGPHTHLMPPPPEFEVYFVYESGFYIYYYDEYPDYYVPHKRIYLSHYWPKRYKKYYHKKILVAKKVYKKYPPRHIKASKAKMYKKSPYHKKTGYHKYKKSVRIPPAYNEKKSPRKQPGIKYKTYVPTKKHSVKLLPPKRKSSYSGQSAAPKYSPQKKSYYYSPSKRSSGSQKSKSNWFYHKKSSSTYKSSHKRKSNNSNYNWFKKSNKSYKKIPSFHFGSSKRKKKLR